MGYALNSWDALIRTMTEKGYSKREMLDAGLAVESQKGSIYDRFRGRVMFPIIDVRGNVIGFGGRVLDDSTPKYLNSPDTPIYNKSKNLFALNLAKRSKAGRLILTEGYMDTIALHQAGFDCAVASLGTSLTEDHARLISRYTKEVILAYDGDAAGVNAAQRAIPILDKTGLQVRVLQMQGAKDPDEFIRKFGREAFQRLLDGSENQMEYRLAQLRGKFHLEDPADRVSYLQEAAAMIAKLDSPVEREIYGGRAAETAGIERDTMLAEIAGPAPQGTLEAEETAAAQSPPARHGGAAKGAAAPLSGRPFGQGGRGAHRPGHGRPDAVSGHGRLAAGGFFGACPGKSVPAGKNPVGDYGQHHPQRHGAGAERGGDEPAGQPHAEASDVRGGQAGHC